MTISKKFLIVASLLLGLQYNIGAYYVTAELKAEITSIFNFMDTLRQADIQAATVLVTQLDKEFKNVEEKYEWARYNLENIDVIDMARIIAKDTTMDAKIVEISAILALKEAAKAISVKKDAERSRKEAMAVIASFVGLIGLFPTLAAIEYYWFPRAVTTTPAKA